jgi:large subunit ribosomal protein L15
LGKTSGRGHKGQRARSGSKIKAWFEGGQMPLQRRIPKFGFKPLNRTEYQVVNLSTLAKAEAGSTLTPADLAARGWIKHSEGLVKVLGNGDFGVKINLHAHAFSKSAEEKIKNAGGSVTLIPRHAATAES